MRLILLLLIIIIVLYLAKPTIDGYSGYLRVSSDYNPKKFNLTLRSQVPMELKTKLNRYNSPSGIFKIPVKLPDSFDAREKWPGKITTPLDQADCGSCWAFAICTSSSDRMRINIPEDAPTFMQMITYRGYKGLYQALNNLDPFHLAACDLCAAIPTGQELATQALCGTGPKSSPCKGEILQVAAQYLMMHGTIDVGCSPRQKPCLSDASMCFYSCDPTGCHLYKPVEVHPISDDYAEENTKNEREQLAMYEIYHYGPIVAGYKVTQSFMDFFKDPNNAKKVFTQDFVDAYANDKDLGGHAIVIAGWGVDEDTGIKYWLIRNSWGTGWGDQGWFRMERGINFMGVGSDMWSIHWRQTKI
jgi:hypothetical protein